MNGALIIDKPEGITSHDVVARVRRILKTKRIGHTGTLDPFATGVLVLLVGHATRLARFIDKDEKEYEAVVRFGFETDTGDRTGNPRPKVKSPKSKVRGDEAVSIAEIDNVLREFRGKIEQVPPMYSAKKVAGKKLYELARAGREIAREPVLVTILELERVGNDLHCSTTSPNQGGEFCVVLRVVCSAGTYIRTLAEDIGRKLGVGAHLQELRRTRAGQFKLPQSITLEELEGADDARSRLIPMQQIVSHLAAVVLPDDRAEKTRNGMSSRISEKFEEGENVRIVNERGDLIAIGTFDGAERSVRPRIVLV